MASSYWLKLQALMRKNLILMKRNIISTLFEILFPISMFALIIILRTVFPLTDETFESFEHNNTYFMRNKSILTSMSFNGNLDNVDAYVLALKLSLKVDSIEDLESKYNVTPLYNLSEVDLWNVNIIDLFSVKDIQKLLNEIPPSYVVKNRMRDITYLGMPIYVPPFYICSNLSSQTVVRPKIASIGIPDGIKERMIKDSLIFNKLANLTNNSYYFDLNYSSFKEYESIEQMEKEIKSDKYLKDKNNLICFGLSFSNKTSNYNYSLHFFDFQKFEDSTTDIPSNAKGMFDKFQSGPDLKSYSMYMNGAYNYMMKIVNEYILKIESENPLASINYGVVPMKYKDFRDDEFGFFFGYVITIIILVAYMVPLSIYVYKMVGEKEAKIKEGMKIMGLDESIYFISYFIQYFVISIFVTIINTVLYNLVFTKIPFVFLYFMLLFFSLDIFALIYFFQSFIDKTRIAIVLSLIIYFMMYCLSLPCMFENSSYKKKMFFALFPLVNLNIGNALLSKFQYHFKKFYNKDFSIDHFNYSLSTTYLMFFIDFCIYLFLGFYLDNVVPHDFGIRKPWYFLCSPNYWCKKRNRSVLTNEEKLGLDEYNTKESELLEEERNSYNPAKLRTRSEVYGRASNFESETIYEDKPDEDVFEIRDIVKIYGDGKKAVDGVNLNFYRDEIFALLGHNGAGKTTLISMLTGIYEATKGKAFFGGRNILEPNNMEVFREILGICPQHDTLFEDLTIREHLELFSIFKGVPKEKLDEEINKTLRDFQIIDISNMIARNLSAGQRRKLSIAISVIGGSQVIFLDEPSSGMDITSRRNLWDILKRLSDGRIIILTTHYMEEASVLGKRIGIINAGKMKCIGSPLFLIEKYGRFMSLNITKDVGAINNDIVEFVKSLAKNVEYEILSEEIMFRVPVKDDNNEEKKLKKIIDIPKFFKEFDENIDRLKISSYSVSMPTLEDVFLNVAAEDIKKNQNQKEKEKELLIQNQLVNDKLLYSLDLKEKYTEKEKFKNDFFICLKRRYLITLRDMKGILMEILGPILLVLFGLLISKLQIQDKSGPYRIDDIEYISGKQKILFAYNDSTPYIEYIQENDKLFENIDFIYNKTEEGKENAVQFLQEVFELTKNKEDSRDHEVDMGGEDYIGNYAALLMLSETETNNYEFLMLLNARIKHCVPIYSYYILKTIIEKECSKLNKTVNISFTHYPFPYTVDLKEQSSVINNIATIFFFSIAFGIMPANFISLLVKERVNNSKHLMRISGINIYSYWIVNFIFEYVKYYITGGICILLLELFDYNREYLYIVYILYGPAIISLTYAISFIFEDESNAQNAIILINFLFGDVGSIIVLLFRLMKSVRNIGKVLEYFLAIVPAFCFDFSYNLLLNKAQIYSIDYTKQEILNFTGVEMVRKWNLMFILIIYCTIECVVYTVIFLIAESRTYSFKEQTNEILYSEITDEEVLRETEMANRLSFVLLPNSSQAGSINNEDDDNTILSMPTSNSLISDSSYTKKILTVKVKNLRKTYNNGCLSKKKNVAINNLNFVIETGECFGLLGLNGAGKTTTFKCITQEIAPDNGQIYVYGKDIKGNFNELNNKFGYCPQFNATFDHLTVYENLEFYARIKGIKRELIDELIKAMITEMALNEFTNKISGRLSGGNKRKLSVAISMLGNPPIILLDEPSTGMDPEARRFMWSVIHKMSTKGRKSSVIMTTHSMDEAETLCKRMGIMVNGEFVCLGTSQQIKDKYGYGFEADIRIKPMTQEEQKNILEEKDLIFESKVSRSNINQILTSLNKENFIDELRPGRLGERLQKTININGEINIGVLLNWVFFVENALKFIQVGKQYFQQIILSEHIENNFLFRLKKGNETKSIGFFFGLFEEKKDECHVTEYSIQQTSLEQIFNKFAAYQGQKVEIDKEILKKENKGIIVDDELLSKLI